MSHAGQHDAVPRSADPSAPLLRSLPLWAQVAVERLDACSELRNQSMLDELLSSYARTYGAAVAPEIRAAVTQICQVRFGASYAGGLEPVCAGAQARPSPEPVSSSRLCQRLLQHTEPLVAISTGHLRPATRHRLASGQLSVHAYPNDYGGFLYVGEPGDNVAEEPELQAIVSLAQQAGIVWIKFDGDAPEVDGLPTFAHEQTVG